MMLKLGYRVIVQSGQKGCNGSFAAEEAKVFYCSESGRYVLEFVFAF